MLSANTLQKVNDRGVVVKVGNNTLKTFVVLSPLSGSGFRSFLHQHLCDLYISDILLLL